jgi:hypothetical protein
LPRGHWRALTKRELQSLHLPAHRDVRVPGADRGLRKLTTLAKPRSTPPATTAHET